MMDASTDLREAVRAEALALGFAACGFARAETTPETRAALQAFVGQGRHMDMGWIADTLERRADPRVLWPEAKTVIVLGMNYGPGIDPLRHLDRPEVGAISVYALGRDYHDVVKKRLKALARRLVERTGSKVKVFVDTAPVMEKPLAQRAGIGWQGKHTNLVSRDFGSWLFLGEIFTTLDLPPDAPEADHCGSCDACRDACPTGALHTPYEMDTALCLAYWTNEAKEPMPEALRPRMGNRIYGCDDCLAVCPWNKYASPTTEPALKPRDDLLAPPLADLAKLEEAGFRVKFSGSPVKRIGHRRFAAAVQIARENAAVERNAGTRSLEK